MESLLIHFNIYAGQISFGIEKQSNAVFLSIRSWRGVIIIDERLITTGRRHRKSMNRKTEMLKDQHFSNWSLHLNDLDINSYWRLLSLVLYILTYLFKYIIMSLLNKILTYVLFTLYVMFKFSKDVVFNNINQSTAEFPKLFLWGPVF